jgi:hypothetical protein
VAKRPITEAAARKQLKTLADKLAGKASGPARLELLRRQATLCDARDAAMERGRREQRG